MSMPRSSQPRVLAATARDRARVYELRVHRARAAHGA
jgi:hypothetical protein